MYIDPCFLHTKLSKKEELATIKQAQQGNVEAAHKLVLSYVPRIITIAGSLRNSETDYEDAVIEGVFGFYKALFSYVPKFGAFRSSVYWKIRGQLCLCGRKDSSANKLHPYGRLADLAYDRVGSVLDLLIRKEEIEAAEKIINEFGDDFWSLVRAFANGENVSSFLKRCKMTQSEFLHELHLIRAEIEAMQNDIHVLVCRDDEQKVRTVLCVGTRTPEEFCEAVLNANPEIWGSYCYEVPQEDVFHSYFVCVGKDKYRTAARQEKGIFAGTAADIRW